MVAQHLGVITLPLGVPSQKLGAPPEVLPQELQGTLDHTPPEVPLGPVSRHCMGQVWAVAGSCYRRCELSSCPGS